MIVVYLLPLSNKTVKDGMFGLSIAPKEILSCLFKPFNLKISLALGNMAMFGTDTCGKSPSPGSGY